MCSEMCGVSAPLSKKIRVPAAIASKRSIDLSEEGETSEKVLSIDLGPEWEELSI